MRFHTLYLKHVETHSVYIHTYIHTYTHTYLPTYIPTYTHTHIHTHIHTHTHTYPHTYTHIYTHIHTQIHTHIHIQTDRRTDRQTYKHTCIRAYLHTCIHAYIHTFIHAYMHIHVYIYNYVYIQRCIWKKMYTHTHIYIIHTHLQCFKESIWKRTGFPRACRPWRRVPSANQFGPCPVGQRSRTWSCSGMRTDRGVVWSAGKSWENQRPILENECFFGWKIIELIGSVQQTTFFWAAND